MPRKIVKARIKHISLCPAGANGFRTIYKSNDNTIEFEALAKAGEELGEIIGAVYIPGVEDTQGDSADADVIKDMAHAFAADGLGGVDIIHDEKTLDRNDAAVVESFLIQKGDERFADLKDKEGNPVDATGGWGVVLKVNDPDLRAKYSKGEWGGISMGGIAKVVNKSDDSLIPDWFRSLFKSINPFAATAQETEMPLTSEEIANIAKAVTDAQKPLFDALAAKETKVEKSDEKPVEEDPFVVSMQKSLDKLAQSRIQAQIDAAETQEDLDAIEKSIREQIQIRKSAGENTSASGFRFPAAMTLRKSAEDNDAGSMDSEIEKLAKSRMGLANSN